VLKSNIEQIYGDSESRDGSPLATGEITDIADGTMFIGLQRYYQEHGSPYKLCFGPKSFLVISDPLQARHVLKTNNNDFDKGILAEILEPIMGKGLIPADPETWKVRRRQIVPGFHKAWLDHMVGLFGYCNVPLVAALEKASASGASVEMEERFCSVALDIIGKRWVVQLTVCIMIILYIVVDETPPQLTPPPSPLSVFNYEFGSVNSESPVVKCVYSALLEAEHRSMTPAPYWDLPFANEVVPRLRKFNADLDVLNGVLDELITLAKNSRQVEDIEELEKRNYDKVKDPSLLRFLVDMKGADVDDKQLRDDLMTMLIAGHETTAAVLTWALFELVRNPDKMDMAVKEIDQVLGKMEVDSDPGRVITMADIKVSERSEIHFYASEPPEVTKECEAPCEIAIYPWLHPLLN